MTPLEADATRFGNPRSLMSASNGVRQAIVAEALTWVGTPWHHRARVRGAGVDCARFLVGVFSAPAVAQIPALDLGYYPPDWHLHQDAPRFLQRLAEYAEPLGTQDSALGTHNSELSTQHSELPLPGDIAMFQYGRHAAHGSIVLAWPLIVHAYVKGRRVTVSDAACDADLARRCAGFWRLKALTQHSALSTSD